MRPIDERRIKVEGLPANCEDARTILQPAMANSHWSGSRVGHRPKRCTMRTRGRSANGMDRLLAPCDAALDCSASTGEAAHGHHSVQSRGHSRCWSCGGQLSRHLFRRRQHQERAEDRSAFSVAAFGRLLACTELRAEFDLGVAPGIYGSSRREAWRGDADHRKKHVAEKTLLAAGGRYRDRTCDPYHVKVVLYR